jgi:A/G-specific adenine glycosylase
VKPLSKLLLAWYDRAQRDLPWRSAKPDPYHVLVSEVMLQQTQVATVIPYFHRFLAKYPTLTDLSNSTEQDVLRLWQGLGYYSRARNLRDAARQVVAEHDGKLPADLDALRRLPGIGPYTAGAIASIAFGRRAALVDGNVARVLCRLNRLETKIPAELWRLAESLVPADRPGDFNSALMELGATLCTPAKPKCPICPLKKRCQSLAAGVQDQIPLATKRPAKPIVRRWTFAIRNGNRYLIEQRPPTGRWAGLWQFVTLPRRDETPPSVRLSAPRRLGPIRHDLTHRRYIFTVYECQFISGSIGPRRWTTLKQLKNYPLSKPQLQIAQMLVQ